ncbi:AsnC family transcriptional regulator [Halegenticoccus tardaugens]|uniref:AsnC family transcriptional regulator n=1 Tax=Halegenticoccus tardaugens TaxID=2071624 RepID=UPI00100ADD0E|nr:AsnC family transcriptional regulator [Halegenticoccus tardaugens]
MRDLDETDRQIIRLLLEDARRPYSDLADRVGLSAPAVSDRVDRLREIGVIRSFTLDLDRSLLDGGTPVLVDLDVPVARAGEMRNALAELDRVEHVFQTADGRLLVRALVDGDDVTGLLADAIDLDEIRRVDVDLLVEERWTPTIGDAGLALTCVECGNTVTSEGESLLIDDERYHFCCGSCSSNFEERFDRIQRNA